MDLLENLPKSEPLVILCDQEETLKYENLIKKFETGQITSIDSIKDLKDDSIVNIVVFLDSKKLTSEVLSDLLKVLKPDGKIIIPNISDVTTIEFNLKTRGFMNVVVNENSITAIRPKFALGSSAKLNLKKPTVWKLDDDDDGDDDLIDPDDLLDENDLKKPDPTSLRVCGTTGQRKACKDCSCGLADELATEAKSGKTIDTTDAPKSSCGSCYLGDAFRCASCPYLGMPAFKPGEKIQLSNAQMKSDI